MKLGLAVTSQVPSYTSVDFTSIILPIADRYAKLVESEVKAQWPVASGTSRDGWSAVALVSGTDVKIVLTNSVPYAKYVSKKGNSTDIAQPLADKVMARLIPLMDAEVEVAVAEALAKATRPPPPRRRK